MSNDLERNFLVQEDQSSGNLSEIPLTELFVDRDKNAVFANLAEARPTGMDLPLYLTQQMLYGRRVLFFGPPGSGKTTLLFQAIANARENAQALGVYYDPGVAQYDLVLAKSKDKGEGDVFNQELITAFGQADGCENVGVGSVEEKDRGVSANLHFMTEISSGRDDSTIIVGLPGVKTNQIFSGLLRAEISTLRPEEVFAALERHNVIFEGIPKTPEVAAFLIRMYKHMGKREQIEKIQQEENMIVSEWALGLQLAEMRQTSSTRVPTIFERRTSGLTVPATLTTETIGGIYSSFGVNDTPFVERLTQNAIDDYLAQTIHMEYIFRDIFHIGPQRGIIAVNSWREGKVTQDLSPYLKAHNSLT